MKATAPSLVNRRSSLRICQKLCLLAAFVFLLGAGIETVSASGTAASLATRMGNFKTNILGVVGNAICVACVTGAVYYAFEGNTKVVGMCIGGAFVAYGLPYMVRVVQDTFA